MVRTRFTKNGPPGMVLVLAGLACLVATGCGTQQASRPKTYPVEGTVKYNGQPVEGASVTFVPKEGSTADPKPQAATAITDSSGYYSLGTFASGDGAVPGDYLVKVTKFRQPQQQQQPQNADTPDSLQAFLRYQQGQQAAGPKNELPARYENEKTSGLFFTVQPGPNRFDINLTP